MFVGHPQIIIIVEIMERLNRIYNSTAQFTDHRDAVQCFCMISKP